MKKTIRFYIIKTIISAIIVVGLCLLIRSNYLELIGAFSGYLVAAIGADLIEAFFLWREDKNKIASGGFPYDENYYCHDVAVGRKKTKIWYEPIEADGKAVYTVEDDPKKLFALDPLLQANFAAIMQAHRASFIANPIMIRLDDYEQREDGSVRLMTSRTAFYNDLVTNRSMDYTFNGDMTVREIYESGKYLSPLGESKMSNHLGFGVFVFQGNYMIVACRGRNATLSKNKFTAALAFGLSENDLITAHDPLSGEKHFFERDPVLSADDLFAGIILVRLADALNLDLERVRQLYGENKIKIYTHGFGRLIYTGGKPQIYSTVVIDEDVDLSGINDKTAISKKKKSIDFNKAMVFTDRIELKKEGGYILELSQKNSNKILRGEAEKSFFISYWHLHALPPIEGVPAWIYETAQSAE